MWYVWLLPLAVLLLPMRVGVYGAFSLFDAHAGVRLTLFGVPLVRVWADLMQNELVVNGHAGPLIPDDSKQTFKASVVLPRIQKSGKLLRTIAHSVRYYGQVHLLVGTYDPALRWLPAALADMLALPHTDITVYTAAEQTCKGRIDMHMVCALGQLLWALLRYALHRVNARIARSRQRAA